MKSKQKNPSFGQNYIFIKIWQLSDCACVCHNLFYLNWVAKWSKIFTKIQCGLLVGLIIFMDMHIHMHSASKHTHNLGLTKNPQDSKVLNPGSNPDIFWRSWNLFQYRLKFQLLKKMSGFGPGTPMFWSQHLAILTKMAWASPERSWMSYVWKGALSQNKGLQPGPNSET